jgi:Domain of unknown function (DUF1883)
LASKPVMLLGNLTSIVLSAAAILQAVSWTIAGATIIAVLSITTLVPTQLKPRSTTRSTTRKTTHSTTLEPRPVREKIQERPPARQQRQTPRETILPPPPPKPETQKVIPPKITPPKTIPTSASPTQPPTKPSTLKQNATKLTPVGTTPAVTPAVKTPTPKTDPNTRILTKGDYTTYDLELAGGAEIACEITASAPVNVYILDADNLNSLDLGEEFWSEGGEEGVRKATLHFVAPQSGKWYLVVENSENEQVSAIASIRKTPSRSGPRISGLS